MKRDRGTVTCPRPAAPGRGLEIVVGGQTRGTVRTRRYQVRRISSVSIGKFYSYSSEVRQ